MKDIELQAARSAFEEWMRVAHPGVDLSRRVDGSYWSSTPDSFFDGFLGGWNRRAAVESDRAQRVPDVFRMVSVEMLTRWRDAFAEELGAWDIDPPIHHVQVGFDETSALLASTPAQPAQQEPDCPRCNGSGEDPEGYFDQSRGPDGDTHDGPCRDCAGTGAAPQPVERKPMTGEINQCDGCRRGLPVKDGIHTGTGMWDKMVCQKHRYEIKE